MIDSCKRLVISLQKAFESRRFEIRIKTDKPITNP